MGENLHNNFIEKLVERYGEWEKVTSKFGSTSFGKIADDLCISTSQFSKLISGTATEGMYIRSTKNIKQLMDFDLLKNEKESLDEENQRLSQNLQEQSKRKSGWAKYIVIASILALGIGSLLTRYFFPTNSSDTSSDIKIVASDTNHPLSKFFDQNFNADFDSPYLSESEVQQYCPCSGFEGTWELENEYKFPLPGSRKPGVYYLAKSANTRMKCLRRTEKRESGMTMLGFESLYHEVWVDKNKTPFSPRYFNESKKTYTQEFQNLDFENNPNFEKVAEINSFFIDEFVITNDFIQRTGEPCGRYATILNQDLVNEFEIDFKHILNNVIGNMTITKCETAVNNFCNPNDLEEGKSVISFDCLFTIKTENLGIGGGYPYSKGYKLIKQSYSDNLLCRCEGE